MPAVPLSARVVEVIADLGKGHPRHRFGSGCIVSGRTVLTAAHVVAGAVQVQVRNPDKRLYPATTEARFVGEDDGPAPDLALVEIDDAAVDLPPMPLGRVNRDSPTSIPVTDCHAVGYPWFAEQPSPTAVRDTVDVYGRIPVLSKLTRGLLSIEVPSPPRSLPEAEHTLAESEWSGMSGGPVVAAGYLLGVVTEHAPREGPGFIMATPLSALEADPRHPRWGDGVGDPPAWWARLGTTGLSALTLLPRQPEPAYWATIRQIRSRTSSLARRAGELAEIHAFATGPASYRWLTGRAWAGKTALMAEAAIAERNGDVDVVAYFLSRREGDADSNRFLTAITPQLADLVATGEEVRAADIHQFRALWARAVQYADDTRRPLLLIIDGLDEDLRPAGSPSVAAVLPPLVGDHAHVLVSSRSHQELPPDLPMGHPLTETTPVELAAFEGAASLAELARQEIIGLIRRPGRLAVHMLGLLAAAAGPLAVGDLIRLSRFMGAPSPNVAGWPVAKLPVDEVLDAARFLTEEAARSLQRVGLSEDPEDQRYQYAHPTLLEYAQGDQYMRGRQFQDAIHSWAGYWRDAGWSVIADSVAVSVPRYLLANYPATLHSDPDRLAGIVGDIGWVVAALQVVGVDDVLATLATARSATAEERVTIMLALVREQERPLRPPNPLAQPGYVPRQLCLQAAKLGEDRIAAAARALLQSLPDPGLVPLQTTHWNSRAADPGRYNFKVLALAVLPDGRLVSGGDDRQVRVWDPAAPQAGPVELGRHDGAVETVAVLADGRVVSAGDDGRVRVWDPAAPQAGPVELGSHSRPVRTVAGLPDGRVVSGGDDRQVRVWNPAAPQADPVELGSHSRAVRTVAVLADGRVVSSGLDGQVRIWSPKTPQTGPVELGRHDRAVRTVAGVPGNRLVSATSDGQAIWVWDIPSATEIARAAYSVTAMAISAGSILDQRLFTFDESLGITTWTMNMPAEA